MPNNPMVHTVYVIKREAQGRSAQGWALYDIIHTLLDMK